MNAHPEFLGSRRRPSGPARPSPSPEPALPKGIGQTNREFHGVRLEGLCAEIAVRVRSQASVGSRSRRVMTACHKRRRSGPSVSQSIAVEKSQTIIRISQYAIARGQAIMIRSRVIRQPWPSLRLTMIAGRCRGMGRQRVSCRRSGLS